MWKQLWHGTFFFFSIDKLHTHAWVLNPWPHPTPRAYKEWMPWLMLIGAVWKSLKWYISFSHGNLVSYSLHGLQSNYCKEDKLVFWNSRLQMLRGWPNWVPTQTVWLSLLKLFLSKTLVGHHPCHPQEKNIFFLCLTWWKHAVFYMDNPCSSFPQW